MFCLVMFLLPGHVLLCFGSNLPVLFVVSGVPKLISRLKESVDGCSALYCASFAVEFLVCLATWCVVVVVFFHWLLSQVCQSLHMFRVAGNYY